jgi:hypothetical protein
MSGHLKNTFTVLAAALIALALLGTVLTWSAGAAAAGLRARLAQRKARAPLLKEAAALGLTYETAMAAPEKALGKHAVWCLRLYSGRAYYGFGTDKPVEIDNQQDMSAAEYNRQSGDFQCGKALVEIEGVKTFDFAGQRAVRLQLRYLDSI